MSEQTHVKICGIRGDYDCPECIEWIDNTCWVLHNQVEFKEMKEYEKTFEKTFKEKKLRETYKQFNNSGKRKI
jgi:hypothetical protein